MTDLLTTDFIIGVALGIVLSSLIPIRIEIGESKDTRFDSRIKAKAPKGEIDTEPPHGVYFPKDSPKDKPS